MKLILSYQAQCTVYSRVKCTVQYSVYADQLGDNTQWSLAWRSMRRVNKHFAAFMRYNGFMSRLKIVSTSLTQEPIPYFYDEMGCLEIWDQIKSPEMMNIILKMKRILIRDFNGITLMQFRELFHRIANDAREDIKIVSISLPRRNTDEICPLIMQKCRKRCDIIFWTN